MSIPRGLGAAAITSALVITGLAATPALAAPAEGSTEVLVQPPGGGVSNGLNWAPSITPDGRYVAFWSQSSNLTADPDTTGKWDIFVKDTKSGAVKKISTGLQGAEANGDSNYVDISADGRYVVFGSTATNLVEGDDPATIGYELFVKDLKTNKLTRLISKNRGAEDSGYEGTPSISADGSLIAFHSTHADLVPGDTNGVADVFVWKRSTGKITRVSVSSSGTQGTSATNPQGALSYIPDISADGKAVVFRSAADNLVKGDTNEVPDIFVHTLSDHRTTRVSVGPGGQQATFTGGSNANPGADNPSISANGRWIAYQAYNLEGLVETDTGDSTQVYAYDRKTGKTQLVIRTLDGGAAGTYNSTGPISADGRFVPFSSESNELVQGDSGEQQDAFVRDLSSNRIAKASVGVNGAAGDGPSGGQGKAVTAGGGTVVFESQAHNLVTGPTAVSDLYLHHFGKGFWGN